MSTLAQTAQPAGRPATPTLGVGKSLLLCLPIFLVSALLFPLNYAQTGDTARMVFASLIWVAVNVVFFFMLRSGKTHRYRSVLFIIMAVTFSFSFISNLIDTRGSMALTDEIVLSGETPFCHLAIPMIIIPATLTRTIIFPGSLLGGYGVASMLVLWIGSSLAMGRGWCSWACFYGGLDEGFSHILRKARIKNINRMWTYLPWAVLLGVVLTSAATLSPIYCEWLCPFKTVTEYVAITNFKTLVQAVIFLTLFAVLVVVLPILTRKRTQCSLFCPFGAMQSLTNKVNIYSVRIDPTKCVQCGLCIRECPTLSLDESSLKSGKPLLSCTKCGKCVDTCPQKAITYHVNGTAPGKHPTAARVLFLYPAYLMMLAFSGTFLVDTLWRLFHLITTGSLI